MKQIKLKKTDISRILRALSLLHLNKEIRDEDYRRLYNKLFKEIK